MTDFIFSLFTFKNKQTQLPLFLESFNYSLLEEYESEEQWKTQPYVKINDNTSVFVMTLPKTGQIACKIYFTFINPKTAYVENIFCYSQKIKVSNKLKNTKLSFFAFHEFFALLLEQQVFFTLLLPFSTTDSTKLFNFYKQIGFECIGFLGDEDIARINVENIIIPLPMSKVDLNAVGAYTKCYYMQGLNSKMKQRLLTKLDF